MKIKIKILLIAVLLSIGPVLIARANYLPSDEVGEIDSTTDTPLYNMASINDYLPTADSGLAPLDFKIDSINHELYLADQGNNRVLVFNLNSSNQLTNKLADYVIGQTNFNDGGDANGNISGTSQTQLNGPAALAVDSIHHRLFVSDNWNCRIMVFNTSALATGMPALHVLGQSDFNSSSCAASQTGLSGSFGIAYDEIHDQLFVSDSSNNRVLVFDTSSITDGEGATHVLGQSTFLASGSGLSQTTMSNPIGVTYDKIHDRLFVGDSNNRRVLVYDVSSIADGQPAINVLGPSTFTSSTTLNDQARIGTFPYPEYDPVHDRLFVSSWNPVYRIAIFDTSSITDGENASQVLGQPNFSTFTPASVNGIATFQNSGGMAYDPDNELLYAADNVGDRGNIFNVNPTTVVTGENISDEIGMYDAAGNPSFTYNTYDPSVYGFDAPTDIALDSAGHRLFVIDADSRVLVFDLDSNNNFIDHKADFIIGRPNLDSSDQCTDSGTPLTRICEANSIFYSASKKRLYVGDSQWHRITSYDADPATISDGEQALEVWGQPDINTTTSPSSPSATNLSQPSGIAMDESNHRLIVADGGFNRIIFYNLDANNNFTDTTAVHVFGSSDLNTKINCTLSENTFCIPDGIIYDPLNQRLFVADSNYGRVMIFDTSTLADNQPAVHVIGQPDLTTSDTTSITQHNLSNDAGLAYDAAGKRLFVTDFNLNRALVFNVDPTTIQDGEDATQVIGQPDFLSGDQDSNGPDFPNRAGLHDPYGIAYDPTNGNLFIDDYYNNRVLQYKFNVTVTPASISNGTVGSVYNQSLSTTGGQSPVALTLNSGTLPAGLILNNNGISGTPTSAGTFNFAIQANASGFLSPAQNFAVTIASNGPADTTPPVVSITAPSNSASVSGSTVTVSANATDDTAVSSVQFKLDGVNLGAAQTVAPYSITWDTTSATDGSHILSAVATDTSNNTAAAANITVMVSNATAPAPQPASGEGGLPASYTTPPTPPTNGFSLKITPENSPNGNGYVQLTLNGGPDAKTMAISNTSDFSNASQIPYATTVDDWSLCHDPTCPDGNYNVYAKYYTFAGQSSPVVNDSLVLGAEQAAPVLANLPTAPQPKPTKNTPAINPKSAEEAAGAGKAAPINNAAPASTKADPDLQPSKQSTPNAKQPFKIPGAVDLTFLASLFLLISYTLSQISNPAKIFRALANSENFSEFNIAVKDYTYSLLGFLGLRRKKQYWGTVFDSITKQPIDPVYLSLINATTNKEEDVSITDITGRYGFFVKPGTYRIQANRSNYIAPSKELYGRDHDLVYPNLYFGEPITIANDSDVIAPNIPMDPLQADWNQENKKAFIVFHPFREAALNVISSSLFWIGLAVDLVLLLTKFNFFTLIVTILYFIFLLARMLGQKRLWGRIYQSKNRAALPGLILELISPGLANITIAKAVTGEKGKFFMQAEKGRYDLKVSRRASGTEESVVIASLPIHIKDDRLVNSDLAI